MNRRTLFVLIGILFITPVTYAVQVGGLYSMQVPVSSQSNNEQHTAFQKALQAVLVKVTGNIHAQDNAMIHAALSHPAQYVGEYGYVTQQKEGESSLVLSVDFNKSAINLLLNQAGLPIWSNERPLTLVWLVVKNQQGLNLEGSASEDAVIQLLQKSIEKRAIPFILPMMDLSDLQTINAGVVWNTTENGVIQQASQRYSPNAILVVRVDATDPTHLNSRWILQMKNERMQWAVSGTSMHEVIQTGVNNVADTFVSRFAVVEREAEASDLTLSITGVKNVSSYAQLVQYLKKLPGVKKIEVLNVVADRTDIRLTVTVSAEALQRSVSLGSMLTPVTTTDEQVGENTDSTVLTYKMGG